MLFKDIPGQEAIKHNLIETVKNSRISHAQLMFGPEGCGKLPLAIAYAQYVNCENKQEHDSCGKCNSCNKFNKLIHPDLHFIFPNNSTKKITKNQNSQLFINEFRELILQNNYFINLNDLYKKIDIENKQGIINKDDCNEITDILRLKSFESGYTVIIIWMVEKLYHAAAPKILKILEEPPEKTLFILITEDYENIISTIKSRTQLIKIPKLTDKDIEAALISRNLCNAETAANISKIADGNLIEARHLLLSAEEEEFNFINFRQWMRICLKINVSNLNQFIDEIASIGREKQKQFLLYGIKMLREAILFNHKQNYLLKYDTDIINFVQNFSPFVNESNLFDMVEEFNKAVYHIERNANPKILFMDLSFTFNKLLKQKVLN